MTMETLTAVEARRHDAGGKGVISDRTLIFYVTTTRVTYTTAASFTPNSPLAAKLSLSVLLSQFAAFDPACITSK